MTTPRHSLPATVSNYLFVEHLAQTLEAMETGRLVMNAVAYRLFARRLRHALAACARTRLSAAPTGVRAAIGEAMVSRYFEEHGRLPAAGGRAVQLEAMELFERVRLPR